jgi:hypothetical protein
MIGSDGSLTPLSVASVSAGVDPRAVVADQTGHYVYAANQGDNTISQYAIGVGGGLLALSPAAVPVPLQNGLGFSLSIDPQGRFLYLVFVIENPASISGPSYIAQYSIGSDGTLTPLAPPYVNVPFPVSGALAIDPGGRYAYLAGEGSAGHFVAQFSIGADGTLAPLEPATVSAENGASGVVIAPNGQGAYVLGICVDNACDGEAALFTVGSSGTLSSTGTTTLTGFNVHPVAMLIDNSGLNAYLLTNAMGVDTNTGAVYQYTVDSSGALVPHVPASIGVTSGAVAESMYGGRLYVLSSNAVGSASGSPSGGHIDQYTIGSDGTLTAVSTTSLAGQPAAMTVVVAQ